MAPPASNPEPAAAHPSPKRDKREYSRDWHRAHAAELYERRKQLYYLATRKAAKADASWETESARFLRIGLIGHAR